MITHMTLVPLLQLVQQQAFNQLGLLKALLQPCPDSDQSRNTEQTLASTVAGTLETAG